jgi:putative mRNA 3-end processing factor
MIKLNFLGALGTIGASGLLVEYGANKIVIDYGVKVSDTPPSFPFEVKGIVTSAFLSHCHLDHSGALPLLLKRNNLDKIYSTKVTKELTELLLIDSIKVNREEGVELKFSEEDVEKTMKIFRYLEYGESLKLKNNVEVTFYDAGHIPGSAFVFMDLDGKHLLYTGDFNTEDTRLIKGCEKNLPEVDILITEGTYYDRNHPDRESQEKELVKIIRETLANDGITIVSGFAVGRIDELLLVLDKYGIDYPVYVDGMAKKAITIINKYQNFLKDPKSLDKALRKVEFITEDYQRKKVLKEPCVILTTSGMLKGGPVVWYLEKLYSRKNCSLVITGFQVEGTPGKKLLDTGYYINEKYGLNLKLKMGFKRLDFSSHVGRDNLIDFIKKLNPEKIYCVHSDNTEGLKEELEKQGFDAVAPSPENRFFNI